jgi:hypothetical protein
MPPGWFARGRISSPFYAAFRPLFYPDLEGPAGIPSDTSFAACEEQDTPKRAGTDLW